MISVDEPGIIQSDLFFWEGLGKVKQSRETWRKKGTEIPDLLAS